MTSGAERSPPGVSGVPAAATPAWPDLSAASLSSSSFSSSAASPMQLHSSLHSSLSDITPSDLPPPSSAPPPRPAGAARPIVRSYGNTLAITSSRSPPLAVMGHSYSKSATPPSSSASSATAQITSRGLGISNVALAGGIKLKRAFAGRRKKSQDSSSILSRTAEGAELSFQIEATPSSGSSQPQVFSKRSTKASHQSLSVVQSPPSPPPPPQVVSPANALPIAPSPPVKANQLFVADNRTSIIPISPAISSAVNFMRMGEEQRDQEQIVAQEKDKEVGSRKRDGVDKSETKEAWRKSDSTMSYHTIRPGAANNRPSRPVSMAESLQSNHTIVPVNKRLSALITDADFGMAEEETDSFGETDNEAPSGSHKASPTPSERIINRRSMSLNLGSYVYGKSQAPPSSYNASAADLKHPSTSISEGAPPLSPPSTSRETPSLTRTDVNGFISPSSPGIHSTSHNIRGRLTALNAASNNNLSKSARQERNLPALPHDRSPPVAPPGQSTGPSFRQTAISMTSSFAPAAGLAKRAVEKMGRAWGITSSSNVSNSGYSSSSSSTAPSSYSSTSYPDDALARTNSNQSSHLDTRIHLSKHKQRRTNAASGTWSITSSTSSSISDSDALMAPAGPMLGKRMRGPMRIKAGGAGVGGGIVFGRDLKAAVRDTAIYVGRPRVSADGRTSQDERKNQGHGRSDSTNRISVTPLEDRMLPAIVVRCAQHLLNWGVQEEGLFRVTGRPSHIAKLRAEFDTGADFDMAACTPGDLDPHAVASIFKAYLRELPEPILTYALLPYFDAAMTQESNSNANTELSNASRPGAKGHGLPTSPRNTTLPAIRKPPSLSTLAMPSFTGMRPPSRSLLKALRTLIGKLPKENHDLILTVTELIRATAKESKETKMPLSNLLLVFCPSLNMNPPLLRVLCDGDGIWDIPPEESPVLDIRRASPVVSETLTRSSSVDGDDEEFSDAYDGTESESFNDAGDSEVASTTSSISRDQIQGKDSVRHRPLGSRRPHVPTIYMDNEGDTNSPSLSQPIVLHSRNASATAYSDTTSLRDDSSYVSTSEGNSITSPHFRLDAVSPALSSSAESLATPTSSSGEPSISHFPIDGDQITKPLATGSPRIVESIPLSLQPCSGRLNISNPIAITEPVQFPITSINNFSSPSLTKKRSIPVLSLPSFSSTSSNSPASIDSGSDSPRRRMKKPSLHHLFSKRSVSSLSSHSPSAANFALGSSPYLQTPRAASDSSVSTPLSAVTAPQSSTFTLPPTIDSSIDSSPLGLELGLDVDEQTLEEQKGDREPKAPETSAVSLLRARNASISHHPPTNLDPSAVTPSSPIQLRPDQMLRGRQSSFSSSTSSNHLGLLDDNESDDDWTRSVLLAADMDGSWTVRHSIKE